ncbi:hypothetical protein [Lentibacillus jeotgali]|uniref:hypothetical protein n=1 Tax=Lentibacillus jeotgali TaxID=558169 RepID=UPI0002627823|nr:hypothetical protein [Lentibacillus jeotgali]
MNEILQPLVGLIGVVIGGVISYVAQTKHQEKTEKKNDKRQKHIAYNNFLLLEGENSPLVIPMHHGEKEDFESKAYAEGTRKILYENLHLFDKKVVKNVLRIDFVEERAEVMGPEPEDTYEIYHLYLEIKNAIIKDYENDIKG